MQEVMDWTQNTRRQLRENTRADEENLTMRIRTGREAFRRRKMATLQQRITAYFLDFLFLLPISVLFAWAAYGPEGLIGRTAAGFQLADFLAQIAIGCITLLFWIASGATPGKRIMGLQIVAADTGLNVRPDRLLLRYLLRLIPAIPMMLGAGVLGQTGAFTLSALLFAATMIWIFRGDRNQTLHDALSQTAVVVVPTPGEERRMRHQFRDAGQYPRHTA